MSDTGGMDLARFSPRLGHAAGPASSDAAHSAQPAPLSLLERWLADARAAGVSEPEAVAFVTVGPDGRPSARTVLLKRIEPDALVFTSALWTRKAREIEVNPHVALLFHWPAIGRQAHIAGRAEIAERDLALELFAQREPSHQLQTVVSRQGEPIEDIAPLRARHAHLMEVMESPPECPSDWGAIRVVPEAIELWSQAPDRMHDRLLYERAGAGWRVTRLAP
jgi:pyridoxamine 5'-phosphate oxidase